ncbi:hypothetical protein GW737_25710 [Escherichia coli]|nr:hypothetical protein [Escherichia coli]
MKKEDLKALRDAAKNTVYDDKGCDLEAFHALVTPPVIIKLIAHIEQLEKKLDEIQTSEVSPKAWLNNLTGEVCSIDTMPDARNDRETYTPLYPAWQRIAAADDNGRVAWMYTHKKAGYRIPTMTTWDSLAEERGGSLEKYDVSPLFTVPQIPPVKTEKDAYPDVQVSWDATRHYANGWNACRQAMLTTAEKVLDVRIPEYIGRWLSAALHDQNSCEEMKNDIRRFLAEYHHVPSKYNGWRLVPDKLTEQMKYRIVPLLATIKPRSGDEYDGSGENAQFLDWVWTQLLKAAKFAYEDSVNG